MAEKKTKKPQQSPKPTAKKKRNLEAPAPGEPLNRESGLTIVGIGASAGGIAALGSFFDSLPSDTGMAFVVITHLHPEHESHMAELLQKHTSMPTRQVTDNVRIEPDRVYVIPPNRKILMSDSHLQASEFDEPHGRRTPIDHFFRSMAAGQHPDPIAVVLSGGGTDGSVGIKDVKEVGGLILVQDPTDAEYDSMPRAALSTGLVDVVMPADKLAAKLVEYAKHRPQLPHDSGQLTEGEVETLHRIVAQVHARTGNDFTQYKRSTILRRVERRMQLSGFLSLEAYLAHMRNNSTEAQTLFNDLLIGVTNFFRDSESWKALEQKIIPRLFNMNSGEKHIRVWSIGCSTGEEAYGLAMLLFEQAERLNVDVQFQIFASDLDDRSIAHAREGLYPSAIEADVSPERLERFFIREGEYYRVKRELRDSVLFTNHNVLRDPPFSRQDLIACRNVLIYLQRTVQDRIFDIFSYALDPDGYLFLGSSESAEHLPDLFAVIDKKNRIYQVKPWTDEKPHIPVLPLSVRQRRRIIDPVLSRPIPRFMDETTINEDQHKRALEYYAPPSLIVNERYTILHVSETAGRFLLHPKGPLTGDLLTLVRPELQMELRAALYHAFEKGKATASQPVAVQFNGHKRRVVVGVRPQTDELGFEQGSERQALVVFLEDEIEEDDGIVGDTPTPGATAERNETVSRLQAEVERLREQLQITMEEYESSNEEMKAANEELQSINEEYRSATEELETSKEELQSVNEELQTVNAEMRHKLDEVSLAHRELENLMGATEIATLYLDRELRIQRYTAGVQELFNILSGDRGRRISDLTHKMGYDEFVEDAEQVLRKLIPLEREIKRGDGKWFIARLRPYRTMEDRIEGVVISFIDINELKESEREIMLAKQSLETRVKERTGELDEANYQLTQARDLFQTLFNANPVPASLTRLEDDVILDANIQFLNYFNLPREEVIGRRAGEFNLLLLNDAKQDHDKFVALIKRDGYIRSFEYDLLHSSGENRNILASIQYLKLDHIDTLIYTFIDITERVRAERQVRSLASDLTAAEQQERKRISQILHDDLQQRIFAVKVQLSTLKDAIPKGDLTAINSDISQLQESLDKAVAITRNLSIDLSPAILQGDSLVDALNWLSNQMHDQYGLNVTVEADGISTRFEDTLRILLFQVVREALFNVVKHAGTLTAAVSFERADGHIRLTISDEGAGFDGVAGKTEQGGILNVQHRLNLMGCQLEIISSPGKGTQVIINIPNQQVK